MKIYYDGADTSINTLLSPYGDVVSESDWFDTAHVLVVDVNDVNKTTKTTIERGQAIMKPMLLLTQTKNDDVPRTLLNGYPFALVGEYKTGDDRKKIIDSFFNEYGGAAKTMNEYCCGGGCCKEE